MEHITSNCTSKSFNQPAEKNSYDTMVPICYYCGFRKERVNHCRLRLAISNLNYDLFRCHQLNDPVCSCGYTAETSGHFLLHCRLYNSIINKTINKLDENEININTFQFGNDQLHLETNKYFVVAIVHDPPPPPRQCVCVYDTNEEVHALTLPPPHPPDQ